jgi:hypothetical protein
LGIGQQKFDLSKVVTSVSLSGLVVALDPDFSLSAPKPDPNDAPA